MSELCTAYLLIINLLADRFGAPLPEELLTFGDPDKGWYIEFNNETPKANACSYYARILWDGVFAGIIWPTEAKIAYCDAANEKTLIAWLKENGATTELAGKANDA